MLFIAIFSKAIECILNGADVVLQDISNLNWYWQRCPGVAGTRRHSHLVRPGFFLAPSLTPLTQLTHPRVHHSPVFVNYCISVSSISDYNLWYLSHEKMLLFLNWFLLIFRNKSSLISTHLELTRHLSASDPCNWPQITAT